MGALVTGDLNVTRESVIAALQSVKEDLETGKLTPGYGHAFKHGEPVCTVGHIAQRAGYDVKQAYPSGTAYYVYNVLSGALSRTVEEQRDLNELFRDAQKQNDRQWVNVVTFDLHGDRRKRILRALSVIFAYIEGRDHGA
jgi:hypothetical protein